MSREPVRLYRGRVEFAVLGQLRVWGQDGPIELASPKERTVLAHLVSRAGSVVAADELVASLWGDAPPRSAAKTLQNYVLRLRNALEPDRHGSPALIVTHGAGYRLAVPDEAIDARRFERLVTLGRRAYRDGRAEAAAETLGEALALWRGPAYSGFEFTDFGGRESRRLEELRLAALEDRIAADLDVGRARDAAPELESLVEEHPLRERPWQLLVLALYRSGRQADALAAYGRARKVLAEELGVDPGTELRELHARVLAQDPALLATVRTPSVPPSLRPPPGIFVGRDRELALLRDAWARAATGAPLTVVLRGPPGSGARRLAGELAVELSAHGCPVRHLADGSPPAEPADRPTLTVVPADGRPLPGRPAPPGLTVVLAGPGAAAPEGAEVIDLGPLPAGDVRALLLTYLADEAAVEAVLPQALRESGGVPGRVHDVAVALARRRLAVRVGDAAARTGQIHRALDAARGDLREGITELREVVEHHDAGGPGTCPWKGLEAYDVADAPWFAGRERLVAELLVRLTPARLVAVVGASGSGKSSVLRAGMLAALEQGALPGSEAWDRLVMRPGPHPMRELVRVALRGAEPGRDRVAELLRRMVFEEQAATRAVLVVDQLEEVWTTCADPGERAAFLDALADIVESDTQCAVVLGVRADYVGELADQPVLARAMADATVLVGAPSEAEVRRAVDHPAGRAGLTLDVGLVDALVADAGDEPGSLPLLSTALTELWERRDGRRLTLAAYAAAGGIRGAVARIAERAYAALDVQDQAAARVLLLRLAGPGEGEAVTRRRVPLAELDALPDPRVRAVVDPLTAARLLSLSAGHVEVAHEALFREWPRLRGWLEEDAAARSVQRRLAGAAADWAAGGREAGELWRGTRLAAGSDFAAGHPEEVTALERAFLDTGQAQHDAERRAAEERAEIATRQNRRLRWLLGGLGLLLVTALVAGVLTVQARSRAETQARVATARELAAAAVASLGADAELSTLLALEAVQHTRSHDGTVLPEAEEALHRAVTASRIVMTVEGIGGALDWSPAGDVFVTEGPERTGVVDVRDARTGASVRSWPGHDPDVNEVAFNRDGSMLATTGDDGAARLWDPTTGVELAASQGPPGPVWAPSFSPDGSLLAALWTEQGIVRLIETGSGRTVLESEVPGGPRSLSFSPDGARLAIAREPPGEVLLVDASTADTVMTLSDSDWVLSGVEWSPDGRWLATCGVDGLARVWDAETGALRFTLHGHTDAVVRVAWSPDSARLATASEDGSAKVWEIGPGGSRQLLDISGAATRSGVTGVAFSPDGDRVMTGNQLVSAVAVWDVGLGGDAESANFPAPRAFTGVDFTPDGRRLVTASGVGSATAWDLRTGQAVVTTGSHADDPATGGPVRSIDVSPDGTLIATAGEGSVRVWDASTGAEAFSVGAGGAATWSADGAHLARTGPEDGLTTIVDRAGKTVAELREEPDFVVLSVAFSPDASLLATARTYAGGEVPGPGPDQVTIWDWRRGVAVATMPTLAEHIAFDPTGARLATADPIGAAAVWDVASGRKATTFEAHRAGVWDVAFSPDGGAVATGGRDGTVRLWDPETGVSRLVLGGDQGPVWAVRFSPDGTQLASSHANGVVRIWALDLADLVEIAQDQVTRGLSDAECQQYLHVDTCPPAAR